VERQKNLVKAAGTLESESFFLRHKRRDGGGQKRLILCVSVPVTVTRTQGGGEGRRVVAIAKHKKSPWFRPLSSHSI
jgi:hypothetical protein